MRRDFLIRVAIIALLTKPALAKEPDWGLKNRAGIVASFAFADLAGQSPDTRLKPDVVWIYDFLMRKYGLPELRQVKTFRNDARLGRFANTSFAPLTHILSPGTGNPPDLTSGGGHRIDNATFGALWCDRITLPQSYISHLDALSAEGEYALTHAYLAIQILKEKRCDFFMRNESVLISLDAKLRAETRSLAESNTEISDLEIEAAAFYAFATGGAPPSEKFLNRVLRFGEQLRIASPANRLKPHTVVLLLWFLLEYLRPDAPKVKISGEVRY